MPPTKKILFPLAFLLALALAPRPAGAVYMTAKDLSRACLSEAARDISYCLGYIAGVIDYHVMLQSLGTAPTTDFCLPAALPAEDAAVAVLSFLRKSPQHGEFIAGPAIVMALHENYPCAPPARKKRKRK